MLEDNGVLFKGPGWMIVIGEYYGSIFPTYSANLYIDKKRIIDRDKWMEYYNAGDFEKCITYYYDDWNSDIYNAEGSAPIIYMHKCSWEFFQTKNYPVLGMTICIYIT